MTTAFPLLRLPYLVLMPILEQMNFLERLSLSILSKRARMFLKLLKMKSKYINLILKDDRIEMKVFSDKSEEVTVVMYIDIHEVSNMIYRYEGYFTWCIGGPLPLDYAVSIMDVMHCKSINQFIVEDVSEHDCIPIVAKIPKIDEVVVEHISNPNFFSNEALLRKERRLLKVLSSILPVSSAVAISYRFQNHLGEILKGNFDAVTLKHSDNYITFNDLSITNAKVLEIHTGKLDERDMNRYFKLWTKKICNDRLEYLEVRTYGKISMDLLLDGLNAVPVRIETKKTFRALENVKRFVPEDLFEKITREFDITRADGRRATIKISNYGNVFFYVWPEPTNLEPNLVPNQSTNFNWNRDHRVLSICLYSLIVLLACWLFNSLF